MRILNGLTITFSRRKSLLGLTTRPFFWLAYRTSPRDISSERKFRIFIQEDQDLHGLEKGKKRKWWGSLIYLRCAWQNLLNINWFLAKNWFINFYFRNWKVTNFNFWFFLQIYFWNRNLFRKLKKIKLRYQTDFCSKPVMGNREIEK